MSDYQSLQEAQERIKHLERYNMELKEKLQTTTEVGEALTRAWNKLVKRNEIIEEELKKLKEKKGHEYKVSCMVDKSLGFLEKKVERADTLIRSPHKILFTKAKKGQNEEA